MDYIGILKKAWNVTWRYKVLWLFGFLAGSSSSGSYNTSNYSSSSEDLSPQLSQQMSGFENWLGDNLAIVAVVVGILAIIGIIFWVLSVMAHGALVHQVNEAEEGRPVSISAGFSAGFHYWGRTLLIFLALGLPILVLVLVIVALALVAIVPIAQADGEATRSQRVSPCCAAAAWWRSCSCWWSASSWGSCSSSLCATRSSRSGPRSTPSARPGVR